MSELKLVALDGEDLEILSAHLQDALMQVGDLAYVAKERRFVALVNRFDWTTASKGGPMRLYERHRAALRFERVLSAQLLKIRLDAKDVVLSLLAISFEPTDAPGGYVMLTFAGGGGIRLEVECIEAGLADLGPVWKTASKPNHPDDPAGS